MIIYIFRRRSLVEQDFFGALDEILGLNYTEIIG